jgi:hypothetical protein
MARDLLGGLGISHDVDSLLAIWGSYRRFSDNTSTLGYPKINVLHPKHGVGQSPDKDFVFDNDQVRHKVLLIDQVINGFEVLYQNIAYLNWVMMYGDTLDSRLTVTNKHIMTISRTTYRELTMAIKLVIGAKLP